MLVLLLLLSLAAAVAGGPPAHLTLAASLQRLHERAGALGPAGRLELRDLTAKHRAYTLQNRTAQWAWAAPPPPRQPVKTVPAGKVRYETVIVGAGISGLATALSLVDMGHDPAELVVLEMRERVGGRLENLAIPGRPGRIVEAGGTWIAPSQTAALLLAARLGLEDFESYYNYPGCCDPDMSEPSVFPTPPPEVELVQAELAEMAATIDLDAPWDAEHAGSWDAITYYAWLATVHPGLSAAAVAQLQQATVPYGGSDGPSVSLLYHLFYLQSAGGWRQLLGNRGGAQDLRLLNGTAALADRLAALLAAEGVLVATSHNVSAIALEGSGDSVAVTYSIPSGSDTTIDAGHCVVAMSTPDAGRLRYLGGADGGPFPTERLRLMQELRPVEAAKAFIVFGGEGGASWQRSPGLDSLTVPASGGLIFDYSPMDGSVGVLMSFVADAEDPVAQEIWKGVLRLLLAIEPNAPDQPIEEIFFHSWSMRLDGGTKVATTWMPVGLLSSPAGKTWRAPIGRLHWAGSDTAAVWSGYIDGGITAGQRAAAEFCCHK